MKLNEKALESAIQEGIKQFEQQMQLGGGNLNTMFGRVISTYLNDLTPSMVLVDLEDEKVIKLVADAIQPLIDGKINVMDERGKRTYASVWRSDIENIAKAALAALANEEKDV